MRQPFKQPSATPTKVTHQTAAWVQLARTFTAHHRQMLAMLIPHDLTGPQFDVLATAHRQEGMTQQQVADNLLVTKGNVALVIDNLERDGLIERRADPKDNRLRRLHLTAAGSRKLKAVFKSHAAAVTRLWSGLTEQEIETLKALLHKLEARCTDLPAPGDVVEQPALTHHDDEP